MDSAKKLLLAIFWNWKQCLTLSKVHFIQDIFQNKTNAHRWSTQNNDFVKPLVLPCWAHCSSPKSRRTCGHSPCQETTGSPLYCPVWTDPCKTKNTFRMNVYYRQIRNIYTNKVSVNTSWLHSKHTPPLCTGVAVNVCRVEWWGYEAVKFSQSLSE